MTNVSFYTTESQYLFAEAGEFKASLHEDSHEEDLISMGSPNAVLYHELHY